MINRILLLMLVLLGSTGISFSQNCTACFSAIPDSNNPMIINLDASCSNASSTAWYDWYVDGIPYGAINQPYFQLPFSQAGNFTVTLVLNDGACIDSSSQNISINGGCNAVFLPYNFTNSSFYFYHIGLYSNTASYQWDFGDGATASGQYGFHAYSTPGTYNVCLTVTDTGCSDVQCQTITVNSISTTSCVASFTSTVDPVSGYLYADASSSAYDPTNTLFNWYINGSLVQQNTFPGLSTLLTMAGTYSVTLVLTDYNQQPCDSSTQMVTYGGSTQSNSCFACLNYYYNPTYDSVYLYSCSQVPINGSLLWYINGNLVNAGTGPFLQGFATQGYQTIGLYTLDSLNTICDSTFQLIYTYAAPCTSCLTITQVAGSTSDYIFDGSCSAQNYAYTWSVDGTYITTAYSPQFTYSFNQSGTYNVCVQSYDSLGNYCTQACSSVTVNTPTNTLYDLSGRIYKFNNFFQYQAAGQGEAKVYLIKLITGGTLEAIDSTITDVNGYYSFNNKPIDDYRVKVALNPISADYSINIPTYYNSGVMWYDANVITLFANSYNRDVYMQYGINNGGSGFISGSVFQGANRGGKTRSGNAQDVTLILVDQSTNDPIAYAKPDASGNYQFSNIPMGTYKVYGELLNRASIPDNITISATQNVFTNKNFSYTHAVIQPTNMALSVNETEQLSDLRIVPNPATQIVTISNDAVMRNTTILDVTGRVITRFTLKAGEQRSLDCTGWNRGLYIIQTESNGKRSANRLLLQ